MITKEQRAKLEADLPLSAIAERDGGGGKKLSYVEGWWTIGKMNEIFPEGWSYDASATHEIYREKDEKGMWNIAFSGKCRVEVAGIYIADVGCGIGKEKDLGKAAEKAMKEAATDSLKRCLKSLGNVLGLALYDKDKERARVVDDTQEPAPMNQAPPRAREATGSALAEAEAAIKSWPTLDKEGAAQLWASLSQDAKRMVREWKESTSRSRAA